MFELLEAPYSLQLSYNDLTGITHVIPELHLADKWQVHRSPFCLLAKSTASGSYHCSKNKKTTQWLAGRGKEVFCGACHLGMQEIVAPVYIGERLIGVLHFGGFLLKGSKSESADRVKRNAQKHGIPEKSLASLQSNLPECTLEEVHRIRSKMQTIVDTIVKMVAQSGVKMADFPARSSAIEAVRHSTFHSLVQRAIHEIQKNPSDPFSLRRLAAKFNCNPEYLCRLFSRDTGLTLGEYLARVRVARAATLLQSGKFQAVEVAFMLGFQDQSHFGRTFKKYIGVSPGQFRKSPELQNRSFSPLGDK